MGAIVCCYESGVVCLDMRSDWVGGWLFWACRRGSVSVDMCDRVSSCKCRSGDVSVVWVCECVDVGRRWSCVSCVCVSMCLVVSVGAVM